MNKRMVTHLIGLGLLGLSATSWAEEPQVMVVDMPGDESSVRNPIMARTADAAKIEVVSLKDIDAGEKIIFDSATAISIVRDDISKALSLLTASDLGNLAFYTSEDAGAVFAALKDGIAEDTLKKQGWKESAALEMGYELAREGISLRYAFDLGQAQSFMEAGQDAILVDGAIGKNTLKKFKNSRGYVGFSDGQFTMLAKKGKIRPNVILRRGKSDYVFARTPTRRINSFQMDENRLNRSF